MTEEEFRKRLVKCLFNGEKDEEGVPYEIVYRWELNRIINDLKTEIVEIQKIESELIVNDMFYFHWLFCKIMLEVNTFYYENEYKLTSNNWEAIHNLAYELLCDFSSPE